jgi:hypothetical protein
MSSIHALCGPNHVLCLLAFPVLQQDLPPFLEHDVSVGVHMSVERWMKRDTLRTGDPRPRIHPSLSVQKHQQRSSGQRGLRGGLR